VAFSGKDRTEIKLLVDLWDERRAMGDKGGVTMTFKNGILEGVMLRSDKARIEKD